MQIYQLNKILIKNNIVVDLSNILHLNSKYKKPLEIKKFYNLDNILKNEGFNPIYIADATLRYKIDNRTEFEKLVSKNIINLAPAHRTADVFILKYAKKFDCFILSNDKFSEYYDKYDKNWIDKKRITVMYINNNFVIE